MLKPVKSASARTLARASGRFAIVASRYNSQYVDGMLVAAQEVLSKARVDSQVVRVPGAFEIPVVAAKLASGTAGPYAALICLGVILRGETTHAQFIGESVTQALAQIQVLHQVPIIHEVLLLENEKQAQARCLDAEHNRGAEAAHTALEMARTMRELASRGARRTR